MSLLFQQSIALSESIAKPVKTRPRMVQFLSAQSQTSNNVISTNKVKKNSKSLDASNPDHSDSDILVFEIFHTNSFSVVTIFTEDDYTGLAPPQSI